MNYRLACVFLFAVRASCLADGVGRPFPQHTTYTAGSILPKKERSELDSATADFYRVWKKRYFQAGCEPGQAYIFCNLEKAAAEKNTISVSEGHGYGMMLMAYFAGSDPQAQASFDQLYAFFRAHPSRFNRDLMAWQQRKGCVEQQGDDDSATDGDFDIAYALLLADRQWGSAGAINYRAEALKVIAALKSGDLNPAVPSIKLGDWAQEKAELTDSRLSDFMPSHFRSFSVASGDPIWESLGNAGYKLIERIQTERSPDAGMIPDFARKVDSDSPVPAGKKFMESAHDGEYFYNACRCPFRIGVDYLLHGEPRAHAIVGRLDTFIERVTNGDPDAVCSGYTLAGKIIRDDDTSLAFTAPFAVAAMCDPASQKWLDALWEKLVRTPAQEDEYYGNTIKLLCMLVASGNWWEP